MLYRIGRNIFALAVVAFGAISLMRGEVLLGLEPIPPTFPGRLAFAYLSGVIMLASGMAMLNAKRSRIGATMLSALFAIWLLCMHVPTLVRHPANGGAWTTALELIALLGIALTIAGASWRESQTGGSSPEFASRMASVGRLAFAVSLPGFGALHFVYAQLVSGIIPEWFPFHLFLTYAIGVGFVAAGLSIASGIKARLAGLVLGGMFAIWVVVLHIPLSIKLNTQNNWTSLFIAVAMCGGSWVMAALARDARA